MADYERFRDTPDRVRSPDDHTREAGRRWDGDDDRDRTRRPGDDYGAREGRRDWPQAGEPSRRYGSDDRGYGFGRDEGYRSATRDDWEHRRPAAPSGYGRPESGRPDRDWRSAGAPGRSVSELAFGRDGSGRDWHRAEDRGWFDRAGDEVASWFGDEDAERRRRQDSREDDRYGEHRGRGPKSYQRSDDRIRDDVNDRLTDDPHLDASEIDVTVAGREVTLNGTVRSRADKRRAEDLAEAVSGVAHVQNNLRAQVGGTSGRGAERDVATTSAGQATQGLTGSNPASSGTGRARSTTRV